MIRVAVWTCGVLAASAASARHLPPSVRTDQLLALETLDRVSGRPVMVDFDDRSGTVRWLSGRLGGLDRVDAQAVVSWIAEHRRLFGLSDPFTQLRLEAVARSPSGWIHVTFARVEVGLPVAAASLTVHVDPADQITDVTADYPPDRPVRTGTMRASDARAALVRALGVGRADLAPGHRVRQVLVDTGRALETAWEMVLTWHGREEHAARILVSAVDGRVLHLWSLIHSEVEAAKGKGTLVGGQTVDIDVAFFKEGGHYLLNDLSKGLSAGSRIATFNGQNKGNAVQLAQAQKEFVSPDGNYKDAAAVSAHLNVGKVVDYFRDRHQWTSWDGGGSTLSTFVHFGQSLGNAYWNGAVKAMLFGDGDQVLEQPSACLDIAAHEVTHGVIDASVGLIYEGQSGALNEHVADFFAMMVDPPKGGPKDWLLGEGCAGPQLTTPFVRDIKDPAKGGQPSHAFDFRELPLTEAGDWGGVHSNSGIPNKVGYLIAASIGIEKAEKVYFEILRGKYVGAKADFRSFRNGWASACKSALGGGAPCDNGLGAFDQAGIRETGASVACPASATTGGPFGCRCPEGKPFNYSTGACGGGGGDDCGGVPGTGSCSGGVLKTCVNGKLVTTSCGGSGSCGWNAVQGKSQCLSAQGCGSVPDGGVCDGTQLTWCEGGTLKALDCAQYGKACSGGQCVDYDAAGCTPSCSGGCGADGCGGSCGSCPAGQVCDGGLCRAWEAEGCGAVTFEGQCDGGHLSYCENDLLIQADCTAGGAECGFDAANAYYDCLFAATAGCEGLTVEGSCNGGTLLYCDGTAPVQVDCAGIGLSCGLNAGAGYYDCLDEAATGCGDVTYGGYCGGSDVVWCEEGALKTLACDPGYQECRYNLSKLFNDCIVVGEVPPGVEPPARTGGGWCGSQSVGSGGAVALVAAGLVLLLGAARRRRRRSDGLPTGS